MEPNPEPTDAELVERYVRQQSQAAFAELVGRYVDLVYATALRTTRDRHVAEDVTQAVFLLLARKAKGMDRRVILPGWLHRAARLTAKDAMKLRGRRLRHERAAARAERVEPATDGGPAPELDAALDRLSAADRDALLLRYWQGLTVAEVAGRLNVAENTAPKRLERAVRRLRSRLTAGPATLAAVAVPRAPVGLAEACRTPPAGSSPAARRVPAGPLRVWPAAALTVGLAIVVTAALVFTAPPMQPPNRPAAATAPLVPTSPEQDRQVKAAVYTLRHFNPFAQMDDWPKAIRTLVTVGRPAVPELVAELDRTGKDSTLRGIGYTLRCIGDPRAVPALIRALRRTELVTSDLGLNITDADLAAFMRAHQDHPEDRFVNFGQAAREILGALHAATRHSEGGMFNWRPGPINDAELAAAGRWRDGTADRWQHWWDAHGSSLVPAVEMATLTAAPHEVAAVEAAGTAAAGPLFPTGRPYQLGPVHDVWMSSINGGNDLPSWLSFDREQVLSLLDALRLLPAGATVSHADVWWGKPPVSVDAECQTIMFPLGPPKDHGSIAAGAVILTGPMRSVSQLYPLGMAVWPVEDHVWDDLPRLTADGRPVLDGVAGPYADFSPAHLHPTVDGVYRYPATFLFRTVGGRAGAVKLLASDEAGQRLHLLYRMVRLPSHGPAELPPVPAAAFGPTRTVVLPAGSAEGAYGLVLSSGQVRPATTRSAAADMTTTSYHRQTTVAGVRLVDATVWPVTDAAFDALPAGVVSAATSHADPDPMDGFLMATGKNAAGRRTAVFRTRDGTAGVAQVVSVSDAPPSATVRYKLLAPPPTEPAGN